MALSARNIVHAEVDIASNTAHAIVASPGSGKALAIVGFHLKGDAAQTWSFLSGSTALAGDMTATLELQYDPIIDNGEVYPYFVCGANEAFNMTSGAGCTLDGWVKYIVQDIP